MILDAIQQTRQGWIKASPDFRVYKENQGYISGRNCHIQGYDVHDHSKVMHKNGVIKRFKKHPTPKARVYFVLPKYEKQFLATHHGAVEDSF